MITRSALALAACEGLTDAELAKRGAGSFAKMINRKRAYAHAARMLNSNCAVMAQELVAARKQLAEAQQELAKQQTLVNELMALDAEITDTSTADALMADIIKKPATE